MLRFYIRARKALQRLQVKITWWVIGDVIHALNKELGRQVETGYAALEKTLVEGQRLLDEKQSRFEEQLRGQLAAWQAIDVGAKDSGKFILCVRVRGKDLVQVIDVQPEMSIDEYRRLKEELESRYGARARWIDTPLGFDKAFFDHPRPPRRHRHGH
jgi:hypothetical protein